MHKTLSTWDTSDKSMLDKMLPALQLSHYASKNADMQGLQCRDRMMWTCRSCTTSVQAEYDDCTDLHPSCNVWLTTANDDASFAAGFCQGQALLVASPHGELGSCVGFAHSIALKYYKMVVFGWVAHTWPKLSCWHDNKPCVGFWRCCRTLFAALIYMLCIRKGNA